jgi:hypothetical protein
MTAADAAMASGATYRSFIILSSLLGDIRRCQLKIGFRQAYSRQLAQASGHRSDSRRRMHPPSDTRRVACADRDHRFLRMLFGLGVYLKTARRGRLCRRR